MDRYEVAFCGRCARPVYVMIEDVKIPLCGTDYISTHRGTRKFDRRRFGHEQHGCILTIEDHKKLDIPHKCRCGLNW